MKYSIDDIRNMRASAYSLAIASVMRWNIDHKRSASNYEVLSLAESILQTYMLAEINPSELIKIGEANQGWIDRENET